MEKKDLEVNAGMFCIVTNVHGVLVGNYCAELIPTIEEAREKLKEVRQGDSKAFISLVVPVAC